LALVYPTLEGSDGNEDYNGLLFPSVLH